MKKLAIPAVIFTAVFLAACATESGNTVAENYQKAVEVRESVQSAKTAAQSAQGTASNVNVKDAVKSSVQEKTDATKQKLEAEKAAWENAFK